MEQKLGSINRRKEDPVIFQNALSCKVCLKSFYPAGFYVGGRHHCRNCGKSLCSEHVAGRGEGKYCASKNCFKSKTSKLDKRLERLSTTLKSQSGENLISDINSHDSNSSNSSSQDTNSLSKNDKIIAKNNIDLELKVNKKSIHNISNILFIICFIILLLFFCYLEVPLRITLPIFVIISIIFVIILRKKA